MRDVITAAARAGGLAAATPAMTLAGDALALLCGPALADRRHTPAPAAHHAAVTA